MVLEVVNVSYKDKEIFIKMFSRSKHCICPKCDAASVHRHGTYERKPQALPILGRSTWLQVNAYGYLRNNPDLSVTIFGEIGNSELLYNRMTKQCANFICPLHWQCENQ